MESVRVHFSLHRFPDEIACRIFPLTLEGVAQDWFARLLAKSINSFKELGCLFLSQFLATKKRRKHSACLLSLRQGKEESLKDFMHRFNKEKLLVDNPGDQTVLSALWHGVRPNGPLMAEVSKNSTEITLPEFIAKTEEYINQEEMIKALTKGQEEEDQEKEDAKKELPIASAPKEEKFQKKVVKKAVPSFPKIEPWRREDRTFTPLNTRVNEVFMEIRRDPSFRWPSKLRGDPRKRDRTKFCEYHNDHGHLTEDFHQQPLLLDANRAEGGREPRRDRDDGPRKDPRPSRDQGVVGEIHTIAGGIASGGQSNSARKAYARKTQAEEVFTVQRPSKVAKKDSVVLSFSEEDARGVMQPHDDPLVVTVTVANHMIHRILVDNGSSADVLYWPVFKQMGIDCERIELFSSPLVGFTGEQVQPIGLISLPVMAGTASKQKTVMVDFLVIDRPSAYNVILGRPALNKLKAITSTYHLTMKFPIEEGVGEVKGDQTQARRCYNTSLKRVSDPTPIVVGTVGGNSRNDLKGEPTEPLEDVIVAEDKVLKIGTQLNPIIRDVLVIFLWGNLEVFAWTHEDMPGIAPENILHQLNVDPSVKPVKQKIRKFAPERNMAISEEVEKLLKARFIEEVYYPDWLANVVLVKKSNGKWKMCVDFTDLNKACPKDSFPLPRIDVLMDSTAGYGLLSFMNAFSGYNQIYMHPEDREKTAFITDRGLYCYKVMPFGLKNARATYQRLVNKMFQDQIGRSMEVYVDDMLVKSVLPQDHVLDLQETFTTLKKYGMKLNPSKCAFGVSSEKFLGYMVSSRGIEANPEKIQAVLDMQSPRNLKQLQQLTGIIAALNRFVSRSTDKCLPFFKVLRKAFEWTDECEEAFEQLKEYLVSPPLLSQTIPEEVLYLYLAVSPTAISAALIREEEGIQKPVYFISRALRGAEERYRQMEKLAFALVIASRKLRPYFQAHIIRVLTEYPLKKVLRKLDLSGRLANWAIELGEFDIEFLRRSSLKGQTLANFLAEFTNLPEVTSWPGDETWVIYVDGSSTKKHGGARIVMITPDGEKLCSSLKLKFKTTNNEAEYEAVLAGLDLALEMGDKFVKMRSDSQVVVGHIRGEFEAKGEKMKLYLTKVQEMKSLFNKFSIVKIPRPENERADQLARIASTATGEIEAETPIQIFPQSSVTKTVSVSIAETIPDWQLEIVEYLERGVLPSDKRLATWLKVRA
ncbi:uncharacterized protein LOC132190804 [Corylus avellana]|uniref:uncharacterized protein LOC132190804 n=1 Tax=Corylus avellana TaxID=13451 RepID=UPI00286BA513|nr:uncharacterized protein LOC132190804 [Corylus avellana]